MASAIMHLAIAKKLNEKLNMNERELFLGTLAPDLNKIVHRSKSRAHFYNKGTNIINLDAYLKKYGNNMSHAFEMGYYIHLYVDKLWDELIFSDIFNNSSIKLLNGSEITLDEKQMKKLIYNDFTNLNISIIDKYNIDLSLFYMDLTFPKTNINEIPIKKLNLIVDKMGTFIKNSEKKKTVVLDCKNVYKFIDKSYKIILKDLQNKNLI